MRLLLPERIARMRARFLWTLLFLCSCFHPDDLPKNTNGDPSDVIVLDDGARVVVLNDATPPPDPFACNIYDQDCATGSCYWVNTTQGATGTCLDPTETKGESEDCTLISDCTLGFLCWRGAQNNQPGVCVNYNCKSHEDCDVGGQTCQQVFGSEVGKCY